MFKLTVFKFLWISFVIKLGVIFVSGAMEAVNDIYGTALYIPDQDIQTLVSFILGAVVYFDERMDKIQNVILHNMNIVHVREIESVDDISGVWLDG